MNSSGWMLASGHQQRRGSGGLFCGAVLRAGAAVHPPKATTRGADSSGAARLSPRTYLAGAYGSCVPVAAFT
jgi:hypothetical protein